MRLTLITLAATSLAVPLTKRALTPNDQAVLSLALYLEHLEHALYSGAHDNFTDAQFTSAGFPAGFRDNVGVIAGHEQQHADTIAAILEANGAPDVPPCTYNFPYADPTSFVSLSNMITSVGIGAYLGGSKVSTALLPLTRHIYSRQIAQLLTDSSTLEEAAASILTVEARHDAYLRTGAGASPFPTTTDTGLTAVWAYNLAQMFIVSCPPQAQLPIVKLPKLTLASPPPNAKLQPPIAAGTVLTFTWDPSTFFVPVGADEKLYIAMVNQNVSSPLFEQVTKTGSGSGTVTVPTGVSGAVFACLTTFEGGLTLDDLSSFGTLAGPVEVMLS